jgi:hypothetical protein
MLQACPSHLSYGAWADEGIFPSAPLSGRCRGPVFASGAAVDRWPTNAVIGRGDKSSRRVLGRVSTLMWRCPWRVHRRSAVRHVPGYRRSSGSILVHWCHQHRISRLVLVRRPCIRTQHQPIRVRKKYSAREPRMPSDGQATPGHVLTPRCMVVGQPELAPEGILRRIPGRG